MRSWIVVLLAPLLALAACSTGGVVKTTANTLSIGVGFDGNPTVDKPMATLDPDHKNVTWTLDSSWEKGFFFLRDGIAKGKPGGAPTPPDPAYKCTAVGNFEDAFESCGPSFSLGARTFSCQRKSGLVPGTCYKYNVTLWGRGKTTLDPWIKTN